MSKLISSLSVIVLLASTTPLFAEKQDIPVKGYKLVWSDEFSGKKLDKKKWDYRLLGKRHKAINAKDTVALDGKGNLVLTTKRVGDKIHTAMIGTQGKFQTRYGYFECRVKLQKTHGNWSAFWLQSPKIGKVIDDTKVSGTEVDIYECFRVNNKIAEHNMYWNGYGKHKKHAGSGKLKIPDLTEGYHTFGCEWTAEGYRFFIDGKETWSTKEAPSEIEQYIILSLEVAGGEAKVVMKDKDFEDNTYFDYVRVYKKIGEKK